MTHSKPLSTLFHIVDNGVGGRGTTIVDDIPFRGVDDDGAGPYPHCRQGERRQ